MYLITNAEIFWNNVFYVLLIKSRDKQLSSV